jgi:hypothetical protein
MKEWKRNRRRPAGWRERELITNLYTTTRFFLLRLVIIGKRFFDRENGQLERFPAHISTRPCRHGTTERPLFEANDWWAPSRVGRDRSWVIFFLSKWLTLLGTGR